MADAGPGEDERDMLCLPARSSVVRLPVRLTSRLDACPLSYCDLQIEPLREEVRRWISALLKEEQVNPPTSFPEFRILDR